MVKLFTILLALMVAISFGGMTFAGGFGDNSSIQNTLPLGADKDKDKDKDKKEGDEQKMDDDKGKDKDKDKDKEGK